MGATAGSTSRSLSAVESPKSLLKQQAYDEMKQRIQDATFEPGAFLSERQLALQLGMSKTPVKAALERLESEGFISVSPQQGIVVRDLSVHEIADQFEIRLALETYVLRSVAGKLNDDVASRVRQNLKRHEQAARKSDMAAATELDAEFHGIFCECLGNQEIIRVMSHLREKIHRVICRVFLRNPERLDASWKEHKAIADAVLAGNADLATTKIQEHLEFGKQLLLSPRG